EFFIGGYIGIFLICRIDDITKQDAQQYACHLQNLLDAIFDEYTFDLISSEEIEKILNPFSINQLFTITRRVGRERLDMLGGGRHKPQLGFIKGIELKQTDINFPTNEILHIYPFTPNYSDFGNLFKLLLLESAPIIVSIRLKPTVLAAKEIYFLEEQIARCEKYAQISLEQAPEDLSLILPPLKEQAHLYEGFQTRLLYGLKDNAGIMTIEIASPEKIPGPIIDTLGTLITEPAGGKEMNVYEVPKHYLTGGYEIFELTDSQPAIEAFKKSDITIIPDPIVPPDAVRLPYLFDSIESIAAFRFPPSTIEGYPGINCQNWRSKTIPKDCSEAGCFLGINIHRANAFSVRLSDDDRKRHIYIVGQTGTGKTTMLKTMILDDVRQNKGLCVIDPHGDLFKELLGKIPKNRIQDVVILDPTDIDYPVGLNMLEWENENQRYFLAQEMVSIITKLIEDEYGPTSIGQIAGPIFFNHMRMNLLLVMSNPDDPGTLLEFYNIYQERDYWKRWIPLRVTDQLLERWVSNVLPQTDYTKSGGDNPSMGVYIGSKFQGFAFDPLLRNIFGQKHSTIDLKMIMDKGKILLVNLAKGELSEPNSRFLGMVLLAKIMATAMERVKTPEHQRREFNLYVDEFQSLATQSFITLISEARKFGLSLVLANQFISQIKDERIPSAIFGNVGTIICFRLGQADAEYMQRAFYPVFNSFDLTNLPNWHAYIKTLIRGQAVEPFSIKTVLDTTPFDERIVKEVRVSSRRLYGRPRSIVEKEIAKSFGNI
ncbi:MAG: type IV secretion system DNA-binding domain-containing protein, partial [candidate division WOR-3 bacterium]